MTRLEELGQAKEQLAKARKDVAHRINTGHPDCFPTIAVHPILRRLPERIRQDDELAREAFRAAVPKMRAALERYLTASHANKTERKEQRIIMSRLTKLDAPELEITPDPYAHFVSFNIVPWPYSSTHVPREDNKDYSSGEWYDKDMRTNPVLAIAATHWILEYHRRLIEKAERTPAYH